MKLVGVGDMTVGEVDDLVRQGGKFVVYQYCVSVLILSFKRSSDVHFIRPGQGAVTPGLPFSLVSLVCGWWGIPWGPIWTIMTLANNVGGGKDVTAEVMAALGSPTYASPPAPVYEAGNSPGGASTPYGVAAPTADGRLRCPACGYESASTRQTCKSCRAPLLRAARSA
jgi:hypothetical protein